jgi:hypothetical protein
VEDGLAHLPAQSLPLVAPAQPRAGGDGTDPGEVGGHHVLDADHPALDEDRTAEIPLVGRPFGPLAPPPLGRLARTLREREIGPRMAERHGGRIVYPFVDESQQRGELVFPGQPDLETQGADAQIEERPVRPWPDPGHPPGW